MVVAAGALLHSLQRTQLKLVAYITFTSLVSTSLCQFNTKGCCSVGSDLGYAVNRMVRAGRLKRMEGGLGVRGD